MNAIAVLSGFDRDDRRVDPSPHDPMASEPGHVAAALANLRAKPSATSGIDAQLLYGQPVHILARKRGWTLLQSVEDHYVGWTQASAVATGQLAATHVVSAPRTFVYPGPELRLPAKNILSLGSRVAITGFAETRGTSYALQEGGGAIVAGHLKNIGVHDADPVEVAGRFLGTPFLWGGSSAFGIDCSGLVQLAWKMCGIALLRDSDMLAQTFGKPLPGDTPLDLLQRGDLVFWKGHVAMVAGGGDIIHASGHAMLVVRENLVEAVERIARLYGRPTGFRRLER